MSASLLQVFEQYQKARVQFVQAIAEAATRPQNIDTMQNAGVMQLLRPLLLDNVGVKSGGIHGACLNNLLLLVIPQVPSIQQTAALALGRLANYSDDLAEAVVSNDILPQLVYSLGEQNVSSSALGGPVCSSRRPLLSPHPPAAILQEGRRVCPPSCCKAQS